MTLILYSDDDDNMITYFSNKSLIQKNSSNRDYSLVYKLNRGSRYFSNKNSGEKPFNKTR